MRRILGFLSVVALAVLSVGALSVAGLAPVSAPEDMTASAVPGRIALDQQSLLVGTVLGVLLATLGRLSWADYPRRAIHWMLANERRIMRGGFAVIFLAVLLYY
ncbi:MAG: hypothetical protein ACT4N2_06445 [Hyphomicrobium sp.]